MMRNGLSAFGGFTPNEGVDQQQQDAEQYPLFACKKNKIQRDLPEELTSRSIQSGALQVNLCTWNRG